MNRTSAGSDRATGVPRGCRVAVDQRNARAAPVRIEGFHSCLRAVRDANVWPLVHPSPLVVPVTRNLRV